MLYNGRMLPDLKKAYDEASNRLFLLDYDGTLADLAPTPDEAKPTKNLLDLLSALSADKKNTVVIISGRDKDTLQKWLGHLPIDLVAEHGYAQRLAGDTWQSQQSGREWQADIQNIMARSVELVAGSFVETKETAVVWHYRAADLAVAEQEIPRLVYRLQPAALSNKLLVQQGNKIIEVRQAAFNKGAAVQPWLTRGPWGFVLAAGDDTTDEDLLKAVPPAAFAIKIGTGETAAKLRLKNPSELLSTLKHLA